MQSNMLARIDYLGRTGQLTVNLESALARARTHVPRAQRSYAKQN